jgi:hypothetical protein
MGKVRYWLPGAVIIVVTGTVVWILFSAGSQMPMCQGKPLDVWLDDQITGKGYGISYGKEELARIGPAAAPIILRKLSQYDSPWKNRYRNWWPNFPSWLQRHLPAPKRPRFPVTIAADALAASCDSPRGAQVLVRALKDGNPAVRQAAAAALGEGPGTHLSPNQRFAAFAPLLKDKDASIAQQAVTVLAMWGEVPPDTIALFIPLLRHNENGRNPGERVFIRATTALSLANLGPSARQALPELKYLATNGDAYQKLAAAAAVWRLTSNVEFCLPILVNEMPNIQMGMKHLPADTLAEIGPRAAAAIPMLEKELKASGQTLQSPWNAEEPSSIRHALLSIDPKAAAKLGIKK